MDEDVDVLFVEMVVSGHLKIEAEMDGVERSRSRCVLAGEGSLWALIVSPSRLSLVRGVG